LDAGIIRGPAFGGIGVAAERLRKGRRNVDSRLVASGSSRTASEFAPTLCRPNHRILCGHVPRRPLHVSADGPRDPAKDAADQLSHRCRFRPRL
jgi:hypothetical protein